MKQPRASLIATLQLLGCEIRFKRDLYSMSALVVFELNTKRMNAAQSDWECMVHIHKRNTHRSISQWASHAYNRDPISAWRWSGLYRYSVPASFYELSYSELEWLVQMVTNV